MVWFFLPPDENFKKGRVIMKVLMATMQLDIGGAETHIVELSKALSRRGVEVIVASNGGAYVGELEEAGIKHFKIALHSKAPGAMLGAYRQLRDIILGEGVDIVHAHARIPGFICGLLQSRYKFRFVTTAHWVFKAGFPFNLLTDWGDRSLAVSDDIKQYLIDNYGCNAENIRVTINGVDTEKFSDTTDYSDVAREFGFAENAVRVVYVSRMDEDRSLAAHRLIEAMPQIDAAVRGLEVVIVGGGNDFENIKREAEETNAQLGRRAVIVTGSRTDINKFVAAGDVFVGVSRAALEAMACKKPAVIAGNEGYIGIFDEDKLKISFDTNFCCRGCGQTTADKLAEDVISVLTADAAERKRLGEYSFKTVKEHYSVDTMANDAMMMYTSEVRGIPINEVTREETDTVDKYLINGCGRRSTDVMISGYYGFHNSGDDSILSAIVGGLRESCPDIKISVLSKAPEETSRIYGVHSINRFDIFRIIKELRKTKLLISGGGSLIQDVTSTKSLYYYLYIIKLAKRCGAKVMLYANGIGPLKNEKNINGVRRVLGKTDRITLREQSSLDELKKRCIDVDAEVTADPVYMLEPADKNEVLTELARAGLKKDEKYFVIALRSWKGNCADFEKKIAEFADGVYARHGITPLILPMQIPYDAEVSEKTAKQISVPYGMITRSLTPQQLLGIVGGAELVLGMRMHTLIYAAKMGIPVIGLDYDPKVSAIMKSIGQSFVERVGEVDSNRLIGYADSIINNKAETEKAIAESAAKAERLARRNNEIAISLLR